MKRPGFCILRFDLRPVIVESTIFFGAEEAEERLEEALIHLLDFVQHSELVLGAASLRLLGSLELIIFVTSFRTAEELPAKHSQSRI